MPLHASRWSARAQKSLYLPPLLRVSVFFHRTFLPVSLLLSFSVNLLVSSFLVIRSLRFSTLFGISRDTYSPCHLLN